MEYNAFIRQKFKDPPPTGLRVETIADHLYPFQKDLVAWALRRGRAAIFADCGLGKTPMQLEWARQVSRLGRVLIVAPLAVREQTIHEAAKFGVDMGLIEVVNYDRLHHVTPDDYVGVVLDESSILKAFDGKTRNALIDGFLETPYKLCCTATPSPNDHTELGNHSEFLGIKTLSEMLAEYFIHDGGRTSQWRLKGHAVELFWDWVATWAVMLRKPSDLGYEDCGFDLPPLNYHSHVVSVDHKQAWAQGMLLKTEAVTLTDQRKARKDTMEQRAAIAKEIADKSEACLIWCDFNAEGDMLERDIEGSAQVAGAHDRALKASRLLGFCYADPRVLITKPSIAGFGMNWQHCHTMVFIGASHSYEKTYQAIRRCWRFGQDKPVDVHIIQADTDGAVVANLKRKEREAAEMADAMASRVKSIITTRSIASRELDDYEPQVEMEVPVWLTC